MTLGERIRQLRNQATLTQPELAVKACIEQSYLSKLENDKASPSFDVLNSIAQAFDMDVLSLIDTLDTQYLHRHLAHIPEIALQLDSQRRAQFQKAKKGYVYSAAAIVFGIALVILGNSNAIFSPVVYSYISMGFLNDGEVNRHYRAQPLSELGENRKQMQARIANNVERIDEELMITRVYRGDTFVEEYGPKRRYFELTDQREVESPLRDLSMILGFICLVSGGFGLGFVFRFIAT
ncbi:helix-turn-helix transcriptional regulator [Thalassotalea sp. G2M2-11]|uniref:helix-turn-helix domain-containing protein n=1 Tax=Thalassotalea sp. G2M2-11 TaxID=2787627 RepID=UPI0019CF9E3B|nr:helix-turn-helix transcriptional regulator [Thalassotalea sp. G2M2-11]